jgi:pimeloyl-ACP methyl ester carboxylesterase
MRRIGDTLRAAMMLATLAAALVCSPAWLAVSAAETLSSPTLQWAPCTGQSQQGFGCAMAQVPLDYAEPAGGSITLSVIRHAATDDAHRIGTLFFNPGGPGGLGTADLPDWILLFSPTMRARFDIVSWDPRGIGDSTAVQCFANKDDEAKFFEGVPQQAFPVGLQQKLAWIERFEAYGRACLQRNGALLSHTSTADTARDLDLLRQAVGEPTLNYLGTSYGTFLGAVYANLFPGSIRAMILDGNLAPSLYTNNGDPHVALSSALRFGSDQGISESLDAFLDQCGLAGPAKCAFSTGEARGTHAKFESLLQHLRSAPATVSGFALTDALLLKALEGRFFTTRPVTSSFSGWAGAGTLLDLVFKAANGASAPAPDAAAAASLPAQTPPDAEEKYASSWQSLTVQCGDSPNPRPPARFLALDRYAYAAYGPIGVVDLWADEPCASWPVRAADQYVGPWNHPTPNPVLLIGNTNDPSTPYRNSVGMSQELAKSQLLTVEGYGHTVLLNPSQCAQQYEDEYLVNLALPPDGTVCQQDAQPFE